MFFTGMPDRELLDLRAHVVALGAEPAATDHERRNLLMLLDRVEEELCTRCFAASQQECIVPGPPLTRCARQKTFAPPND